MYQALGPRDLDLWLLPLFEEPKPVPYLQTDFLERSGRFSPDGRWVAYVSTQSGKAEVYVRSFPASGANGRFQTEAVTSPGGGARVASCFTSRRTIKSWPSK
jgi:Tol biopolymer transport system component